MYIYNVMRFKLPTFRLLVSLFVAFAMCFQGIATAHAYTFFSDDEYELKAYKLILNGNNSFAETNTSVQFGNDLTGANASLTWDITNDRLVFDNDGTADQTLQFGNDSSDGFITWDNSASTFVLGSDTSAGAARNNISMQLETVSALPGGAGGLGTSGEGRLVILDTADNTAPGCTVSPNCSAGTYIWDGAAWISLVGSATSTNLTKVVTVGSSGSDYTTIAGAATYLQTRSGGIMLLSAETHNITTAVNLTNTTLIGKDPSRTTIQISGAGRLDTFDTTFEFLTLDVNSINTNMAIDVQTGSTSLIFNYVEMDVQDSGDSLIDSSAGTAPTVTMKFIKSNQSGTNGVILKNKATGNLNVASSIFVDSRGTDEPLKLSDWDVTVAGGGSVLTNGIITSVPAKTIYVSPDMNLQGAIDSLEFAGNGGLITLLPGTHAITSTLTINDDDIHIMGYGDSSIISASGITGGTTVGAIQVGAADGKAPVSGVVLKDFKLEVTGTGGTDIHGIRVVGGSDNRVDNVTVQKVSGASGSGAGARMGIQMLDGDTTNLIRPVIINSRVLGTSVASAYFTDGIHVTSDPTISGVFGNNNRVINALLDGNFVDYVRETAYVFVGADDSSLFNNRASNMGAGGTAAYGIFMGNATNINMTANVFTGSLSTSAIAIGIECFNTGSVKTTSDSLFNNNIIRGSGSGFATGFQVGATANTTVNRNQFQNNQIYGASTAATTTAIDVFGNADQNNFSNNTITGNGNSWTYGIRLRSASQDQNIVNGNRFNNTTTPISDTGTATVFGVGTAINTVNPTANDDLGDGYNLGTLWVNTNNDNAYILVDNTVGSAIWSQINGSGGGAGTGTDSNTFTLDQDDTGGNVSLIFGTANNEALTWNSTSSLFELSDDLYLNSGNLQVNTGNWLGLGAAAGRIEFDDQAVDEVNILAAHVGIGTQTPLTNFHIYENNTDVSPALSVEQNGTGDSAMRYFLTGGQNISMGIDNDDNDNFKISNTTALTGTTYSDANTMLRVHTETGSVGIIDFNHQSRTRAYRATTTQSIPNNTWTKIQFNAETYDEQGEFDSTTNYRFTAKEDGYYQVNARTLYTIAASNTNAYVGIGIYVNGSPYSYGNNLGVRTSTNATLLNNNAPNVSDVVYLTAGQYIEIFTFQNTGAARDINQNAEETYVSVHKLS